MEHRWGDRVAVDQPVRISSAGITGTGTLRNLSVSGAFIETSLPLAAMAKVRVWFPRAAGSRTASAAALGFVVRRERDAIGVEWCDLAVLRPADLAAFSWHAGSPQRTAETRRQITIS